VFAASRARSCLCLETSLAYVLNRHSVVRTVFVQVRESEAPARSLVGGFLSRGSHRLPRERSAQLLSSEDQTRRRAFQ